MSSGMNVRLGQKGGTQYLPLSAVAPLVRREIAIDPDATYTELGVRSFNKGTFHRRTVAGAEFTWQGLYRINKDDLVFSNIMAWEGAVAMARPEDDGCIGNHRMLPVHATETGSLGAVSLTTSPRSKAWPNWSQRDIYFRTPEVWPALAEVSGGTNMRRRRLQPSAFLNYEMPVPSMPAQRKLREIHRRAHSLKAKHAAIREANQALLPATLERVFASAS